MTNTLVNTVLGLKKLTEAVMDHSGFIAIDTETSGLNTTKGYDEICGYCLSLDGVEGFYLPIRHTVGRNLPLDRVINLIKHIIKHNPYIVHNFKFDGAMFYNDGIDTFDTDMHDTMLMSFCYNSSEKRHGLKHLAQTKLGVKMRTFEETTGGKLFKYLDPEDCYEYAAEDASYTYQLFNWFRNNEAWEDIERTYNLERAVSHAVLFMERSRVVVDIKLLEEMIDAKEDEYQKVAASIIQQTGLANINSVTQWRKYLYGDMDIDYDERWGRTNKGEKKATKAIHSKLASYLEPSALYLEYADLRKELNTYLKNLQRNLYPDGTVKFNFKQTGAATGRFSAPGGYGLHPKGKRPSDGYCGINAQNIPYRTLGQLFSKREGCKSICIDYSQQELRAAANLSCERALIDKYLAGIDGHAATAALTFSIEADEVQDWQRNIGKTINFAILYGAGANTVANSINARLPREMEPYTQEGAEALMNNFFENTPSLNYWLKEKAAEVIDNGHMAYTELGRTRPLDYLFKEFDPDYRWKHIKAGRLATNTQIQGICADITKYALVDVAKYCKQYPDEIWLLATIHDSFIFDMKEDKMNKHIEAISEIMLQREILEKELHWEVPLLVDVDIKEHWGK